MFHSKHETKKLPNFWIFLALFYMDSPLRTFWGLADAATYFLEIEDNPTTAAAFSDHICLQLNILQMSVHG